MSKHNLAVIGWGVVGKATALALGIDNYWSRSSSTQEFEELIAKNDVIFICLPTPTKKRKQDLSAIENVLERASGIPSNPLYVVRSTVLPGVTQYLSKKYKLRMAHIPEFLTEATAYEDALNPDLIVIGCDDARDAHILREIYIDFPKVLMTDSKTAEMIKYAVNCFYATKVIYGNQIWELCDKEGICYETVRDAMYQMKWIGKNHLTIPFRGRRKLGGKCLPKDLRAFATFSKLPLLEKVVEIDNSL